MGNSETKRCSIWQKRGSLDEGIGSFDSDDLRELIEKVEKAEQNIIKELRSIKEETIIKLGDNDET